MATLTHELLHDYANTFHTYGELSNPVWFLGLEEGGGENLDEASRKILSWHEGGRRPRGLTGPELDEEHRHCKFLRTEGKPAELQTTWANQLRVLLGMAGEPLDNGRVRHLQTRVHGRLVGPTCLMELFPLPCRDAGAWIYGDVPHEPVTSEPNLFTTKKAYRDHYLPKRLETIAALVKKHRPAALICTSWTYRDRYSKLLSDDMDIPELGLADAKREALIGRLHDTVVAVCSHPAARIGGPRNAFYHALGGVIAEQMREGVYLKLAV